MTEPTAAARAWSKADRARRARLGQCSRCKADAAPDRSMCALHLSWDRLRCQSRYQPKRGRRAIARHPHPSSRKDAAHP